MIIKRVTRSYRVYIYGTQVGTANGQGNPYEVTAIDIDVNEAEQYNVTLRGYKLLKDGSRRVRGAGFEKIYYVNDHDRNAMRREVLSQALGIEGEAAVQL